MPFDSNEGVGVAQVRVIVNIDHLFFLADEAPNLVAFNVFHRNVDDQTAHELFALLASDNEQTHIIPCGCAVAQTRNAVNFETFSASTLSSRA